MASEQGPEDLSYPPARARPAGDEAGEESETEDKFQTALSG